MLSCSEVISPGTTSLSYIIFTIIRIYPPKSSSFGRWVELTIILQSQGMQTEAFSDFFNYIGPVDAVDIQPCDSLLSGAGIFCEGSNSFSKT